MTAIMMMPITTVTDRLLVHKAMTNVGIIANNTLQSIVRMCSLLISILFTTSAVRIQIGINCSHLIKGFGSGIARITKNGMTLGIKVTIPHPIINRNIEKFRFIYLSPPQWLRQLWLKK